LPALCKQVAFNAQHLTERQQGSALQEQEQDLKDLRAPDVTPDFGRTKRKQDDQQSSTGRLPQTVDELATIVASNCPIFHFHPEEQ
jgi:hypothetical protein